MNAHQQRMFLGAGGELESFKLNSPLAKFNEQGYYHYSPKNPLTYSEQNTFNLSFSPTLSPTPATLSSFCFFKSRDFSLVTCTKTEAGPNPKTKQVKLIVGNLDGDIQLQTHLSQGFNITDVHPLAQAQEVTLTETPLFQKPQLKTYSSLTLFLLRAKLENIMKTSTPLLPKYICL